MRTAPQAALGRPGRGRNLLETPADDDAPRLLLSPDEAARALSVSRSQLYRLIREGRLRSVMLGGSRRIPVASLERLVEGLLSVAPSLDNGSPGSGAQPRER